MKHNMSRRNALTLLGKVTLLSACGGSSTLFPTPGTGLFALYPPRAFAQNTPSIAVTPSVLNATGAVSFSLKSGALPPGLHLNADGSITGTPTTQGWSNFAIEVTNGAAKTTAWCNYFVHAAHHVMENHWLANTGGRPGFPTNGDYSLNSLLAWNGNAGNFLTDIGVIYDWGINDYILQALTGYEETGLGNKLFDASRPYAQLGANYYRGQRLGKGFSNDDPNLPQKAINSSKSTQPSTGLKASIVNFYGRFCNFDPTGNGLLRNTPPPTGASAPYVLLSDTRKITVIADPTAVHFDPQGRLWIADNGPDQNIKIFNVGAGGSLTTPVATFGEAGGVFAGPRPGATGDFRFWGLRGIDHDPAGNLYIACSGLSMQIVGGTDIRQYSPDGTKLQWQVYGIFLDTAAADPSSHAASMYLTGKRYTMDYSKAPGASCKWSGVTLDPFNYTDDPRVSGAYDMLGMRRINGKLFMFLGSMTGNVVVVYRFNENSDIAILCAYLCLTVVLEPTMISPLHPTWVVNEENKRIRWAWRDNTGDGHFTDASEFVLWENWTIYAQGVDIDENGGIWFGGNGVADVPNRNGGVHYWAPNGLDANGVPNYDFAHPQHFDVPFSTGGVNVNRLKYIAQTDTMYLAGGDSSWYAKSIYCYKNYTNPATRTLAFRIDTGFYDNGHPESIHLDQGTAPMTLPWTFSADQDYLYVAYLDNGKDARVRGEVTIYDAATGLQVDFIAPGEVVAGTCGAVDIVNGIHVATDAAGWKVITLEDDGGAKVMAYRWKP